MADLTTRKNAMSELKPCPFCGDEVEENTLIDRLAGNGFIKIECCSTMESHFTLGIYKPRKKDSEKHIRKILYKNWNKRVKG